MMDEEKICQILSIGDKANMCFDSGIYSVDGYACFYSDAYNTFSKIDDAIQNLLEDEEYHEVHIPSLIDGDILRKSGYFTSFPHQLTVAGVANEAYFEEVISKKKIEGNHLLTHDKYFAPAACLHLYPMLEKVKPANGIYTVKGRVYRFEGHKFKDITRLWDFTVREIIVVGEQDYVTDKITNIQNKTLELARKVFEEAAFIGAADPFFQSKENIVKSKLQVANSLKLELSIPIKGDNVAVASINHHRNHFSEPFAFDQDGKIVTACVGFGLERWLAACLEHRNPFHEGVKNDV
jgi:seryl-tRNA synthetase